MRWKALFSRSHASVRTCAIQRCVWGTRDQVWVLDLPSRSARTFASRHLPGVQQAHIMTGSEADSQIPASPLLHVNYRYGTFYNCPVKEEGISVAGGRCSGMSPLLA